MNLVETEFVRECDGRPAGKPGECFYCHEKLGTRHKPECVATQRSVVVRITVEAVAAQPRKFSSDDIEFLYNESSSCASNVLERRYDWVRNHDPEGECACGKMTVEFVREATREDENKLIALETRRAPKDHAGG